MTDQINRPGIEGIHHVKLPVTDLNRSLRFYETLLGAERIPEADHHKEDDGSLYGYILKVPGLNALLELRLNPEQAQKQKGFDPFTIAVKDKASLERWMHYLDEYGLTHSPILAAIQAWLIVVPDPDEHRIRLYTREMHGRDIKPDENDPWLRF